MQKLNVAVIFGTRPEVIKLAPVIKELMRQRNVRLAVCFAGQHQEMVLPLIDFFEIKVSHSLNVMLPNQSLAELTSRAVIAIDGFLDATQPDLVFVQGDTTTAMCASIAAFYKKIKVAHVEAGLRTYNKFSPFPEEFNRQVISRIAEYHFAPTSSAQQNLLAENIVQEKIFITGNTVIDALLFSKQKIETSHVFPVQRSCKYVLVTGHRRENFGQGISNICAAIKELSEKFPEVDFIYPVHPNPNVQDPVHQYLKGIDNVHLIPPVTYPEFTFLLLRCFFVITDSGGIQEEAPTFNKPVLITRNTTERNEIVEAGGAILVGTTKDSIVDAATKLMRDGPMYNRMSDVKNPYGNGNSSEIIVSEILKQFSINTADVSL